MDEQNEVYGSGIEVVAIIGTATLILMCAGLIALICMGGYC